MDENVLERVYRESLEERLISYLSEQKHISLKDAMKAYYSSALVNKINSGAEGIQYLDYKALAQILWETEPALFSIK